MNLIWIFQKFNFLKFWGKITATRANINLDEIGYLPISVPPIEKQQEIANNITAIHQEEQALKDKTKLALQKANEKIENLLLN